MGKRYYCDYCDASFPYSTEGRKKHERGHLHVQCKKTHYNLFRSAVEKYEKERTKEKCRQFHSGRVCQFGVACIYSHLTLADLEHLKLLAEAEEQQKKMPSQMFGKEEPSLATWQEQQNHQKPSKESHIQELLSSTYQPSSALQAFPSLPPSLVPPLYEVAVRAEFAEWG